MYKFLLSVKQSRNPRHLHMFSSQIFQSALHNIAIRPAHRIDMHLLRHLEVSLLYLF